MKYLVIIPLIAVMVACKPHSDKRKRRTPIKTIKLSSSGTVEVKPNMASFSVSMECINMDAKKARKCLIEESHQLNKQLLNYGIKQEDLLTTNVNLNKRYDWRNSRRIFEGYRASSSLHVSVKNIKKLEEIYTDLLGNSNLNISSLSYSHSAYDSLKNEAYKTAVANANTLADELLSTLPQTNKEVIHISNTNYSFNNDYEYEGYDSFGEPVTSKTLNEAKSLKVNTGNVAVSATLNIQYKIE